MSRPIIEAQVWGKIDVAQQGERISFKDVRLWPDGAREWDWGEFGTRHRPGITVADVQELASRGVTTMVLSRGVDEQLQVPAETVSWLTQRGITVHVLQTEQAVACYNDLAAREEGVGALIHSTC